MNSLVALLASLVAAQYLIIAVDVVPRLARIARVDREVLRAARWGATSFFIGCAVTHATIALQTLFPDLHPAFGMDMTAGSGSSLAVMLEMVIPHVAQVLGGAVFIGISRSRLEVKIMSKADAAAARELDAQLRSAVDQAPVGIAFRGAADQPRYANAAYRKMAGSRASGAVPDDADLLQLVHPVDRAIAADAVQAGRAGQPVDVEFRVVRAGGVVCWLHLRQSQVLGNPGPRVTTIVEDVTDRVTAQSALAASERRFVRLADSVSVGINLRQLDPPQFLWANAAYAQIVGANLTQDSATASDPALTFTHPDDKESVLSHYWSLAQSGGFAQSEHRVVRSDGQVRWVHTTSSPVRDDEGRVIQAAGTVEDITARKEVEQVVLDERRRLRQAESIGRTGAWERDLESGVVTWSAGMFELWGIDPEDPSDPRGRAHEQVHPDDRGSLTAAIEGCAANGTPFELRCRIHRANDGAQRWINVRGEAGYHDGQRTSIRSSVADVTDQVAVEAAAVAVAARAFQQAVFNASPDVISVWDFGTETEVWTNRSIAVELGYGPHDLVGTVGRTRLQVHPEDQARVDEALSCARDSIDDRVFQVDYRMVHKDGTPRWFSRRTAPLTRDEKGRVSQLVEVIRDINAAMAIEQDLRHSALHDSLTGLPNRTLLFDRIESALARAEREGTEVGILFCDLDGFKRINDTGGHAAGDAVLVEVGERLRHSVRRSDSLARVGGDEFVIVLEPDHALATAIAEFRGAHEREPVAIQGEVPTEPRTMREVAELVTHRIRSSLVAPVMHDGEAYSVSVSIGMTFARAGSAADDVLRDADSAMYLAKQRGRDRFEIFDDLSRAAAAKRLDVERALRDALGPGGPGGERHAQLGVAFQPVFDLTAGHLVGFEALARLISEDGSAIPPDAFIPVAENTGLIAPLGAAVLNLGLAGLARWRTDHAGEVPVTLAVNLSARQVHQCDLRELVMGALARQGLRPADLILELTESILLDTGSAGLGQLRALYEAGVGIAIDDFGTGYASLQYLTTLPISSLKVDKSFTAGLPADETSATIVRAVAALAAELGLTCVVEGIETIHQLAALPAGVLGQGYLLGRPTSDLADATMWAPGTAEAMSRGSRTGEACAASTGPGH